jgi:hypothetical protein
MKNNLIIISLTSLLSLNVFAADEDVRPESCLRTINGVQKEYKCTDFSTLIGKSNICFFKSGIWNYGSYNNLTKKYTVKAVCDAGIKTKVIPSPSELQAKGTSILPLSKGQPIMTYGMNDLFYSTFSSSANVGELPSASNKTERANWSKRRALAIFEGMTGESASNFPLSRKEMNAEQKILVDEKLKTDIRNFASCIVIDDYGVTKSVKTCLLPKIAYDSKNNLTVSYPSGTCYPHLVTVKKVKTNWWLRKTSDSYVVCTGGLQVKPVVEGQEVID